MRDVGRLQGFSEGQLDILEDAIARGVVTDREFKASCFARWNSCGLSKPFSRSLLRASSSSERDRVPTGEEVAGATLDESVCDLIITI